MVRWLRLCASSAGGAGLIPSPRTKIPYVTWQNKKKIKGHFWRFRISTGSGLVRVPPGGVTQASHLQERAMTTHMQSLTGEALRDPRLKAFTGGWSWRYPLPGMYPNPDSQKESRGSGSTMLAAPAVHPQ